uniref:G-protein coupled receptors family 1 profile domain-containing protein n=1 Tax=Catharus ustulatus TaxID=91951 RepID=A0A8C3TUU1_CATUS
MCNETWPTQSPCSKFSLGVLVLLALLMVLLSLVTILGNSLVILAFIMDKNLRHRSNYFFLNLAVSDFAVVLMVYECITLQKDTLSLYQQDFSQVST